MGMHSYIVFHILLQCSLFIDIYTQKRERNVRKWRGGSIIASDTMQHMPLDLLFILFIFVFVVNEAGMRRE